MKIYTSVIVVLVTIIFVLLLWIDTVTKEAESWQEQYQQIVDRSTQHEEDIFRLKNYIKELRERLAKCEK